MPTQIRQREDKLQPALRSLSNGEFKSRRACARAYDVSESTLRLRQKGGINKRAAQVEKQLLRPEQEHMLADWIIKLDAQGHAPGYDQVREMVRTIRRANGVREPVPKVGENWIKRFKDRNPRVATIIGKPLGAACTHDTSEQVSLSQA